MQTVTLRTARLELSIPTEADADAITAAAQDPEVPRWTTLPFPYERAHADDFIAKAAQWWAAETELTWAIRLDGAWIGMIGLQHLHVGGDAEIGFWLAAHARANGYLTEAARAVIDFAFAAEPLDLKRIEWQAIVGNIPSARTARTLGFRYEGTMRQKLVNPRGRDDGWVAGLLPTDDRSPADWPILSV
ncbi:MULTISPECIES: GNAT family N-acetyltransferase [unclassified Microbacterium]|uniref:GNAT family N-acetyltransferase n=1 Tax=unclassified Microbacterium TaxID=2609290 RepID=UPI00214AF05C|nr:MULTISPECIES: GNAT family N-acetyltransferase [unclassified Microbacterium]MCR2785154.1 GNAT family N-acetyltransferase [Microbacterium sp. zg.B96]MDL5352516.1 GNAT family N-acetyltransferase [Microbacterium sp. zg-YB36]WIM16687.1 GNAT family N-acetyltransferase [Microbacterium sp. zg-B96]